MVLLGLLPVSLGGTLRSPSAVRLWRTVGTGALWAAAGVVLVRQVQGARRFLAENPRETLGR